MPLITLTTDFGTKDPDLGYLKSQIIRQIPDAQILDISHQVTPFDPQESVYIIENSLQDFPENTIHIIGIDSTASKQQAPVLIVSNGQYYLGNDNGILATALAKQPASYYLLKGINGAGFMQTHILAAAKISKGIMPDEIGQKTPELQQVLMSNPLVKHDEQTGKVSLIAPQVIYNDHYGNAIFNLKKETFEAWQKSRKFKIKLGHYEIDHLIDNYHDGLKHDKNMTLAGEMFARFNRFGYFEIFIYKSNRMTGGANTLLGLQKNKTVHIIFEE